MMHDDIPAGGRCDGCRKGDPYGIDGYTGDVFCHLQEEVVENGEKTCGINYDTTIHRPQRGRGS